MQYLTDDILWDSFRQGNKDALALLFERHYATLYRYGHKIHADREAINDLVQDLFVEIWQQQSPKPVLSIKGYLLQSLRYKIIHLVKRQKSTISINKEDTEFTVSAEDFLIIKETDALKNSQIANAIQLLSPRQREIIYLRFYVNLSYKEICGILSVEYQIARNHLYAGLKKLKSILQSELKLPYLD